MAYEKQTWVSGEIITEGKLNHMEDGIADMAAEGATQIANIQAEGTTQKGLVTSEGTTQVANVQAKGTEVLDSIPSDYTSLNNRVELISDEACNDINSTEDAWQQGWWGATTGIYDSAHNNAICIKNYISITDTLKSISCTSAYKFRLQAWDQTNAYVGIWNGNAFAPVNPNYYLSYVNVDYFRDGFPTYKFKLVMYAQDGTSQVSPSDAVNVVFNYSKWNEQYLTNEQTKESILELSDYAEMNLTFEEGYYYTYNPISKAETTAYSCTSIPFINGDRFLITARGTSVNVAFYQYADASKEKIIDSSGTSGFNLEFIAEQDGTLYINTDKTYLPNVSVKKYSTNYIKDKLETIENNLSVINAELSDTGIYNNGIDWEFAKIGAVNGDVSVASNRLKTIKPLPGWVNNISVVGSYEFGLFAYSYVGYVGWWNGTSWSTNDLVWKNSISITEGIVEDGYDLYVVLRKSDNSEMTIADADNIKIKPVGNDSINYVIDSTLTKKNIVANYLGSLTYHQSFTKYNNKYYSTDGSNIGVQDENFVSEQTVALSVGHGNGFCLGSSNKGYISGWSNNQVYVVNLDDLTLVETITLPTTGFTTCAVDEDNGLMYIFQRSTYPSTKEKYNLITYDYVNEQVLNTVQTSVAYAAMQACDYYRDRIIVLYGAGTSEKPNGFIVYSKAGEILGEYVLKEFDTQEPEGVFFDRDTHDLLISLVDKRLYRIKTV